MVRDAGVARSACRSAGHPIALSLCCDGGDATSRPEYEFTGCAFRACRRPVITPHRAPRASPHNLA